MKKHFNYFLLVLVCGLLAFSALFFYCLSAPASLQKYGNANYYFPNQNLSIYNYKHQTLVAKKMWDNQQEYQWTCWRTNFL